MSRWYKILCRVNEARSMLMRKISELGELVNPFAVFGTTFIFSICDSQIHF